MTRKFSIPYNNTEPEKYLELIEPYKENIDNIYLGIPGIESHCNDNSINHIDAFINTKRFLELSKGKYKRLITLNKAFYSISDVDKSLFILNTITPLILTYEIEGVIVSDFNLAVILKETLPDLEIQTSCNTYQFNLNSYKLWNKEVGVTTFNPPREVLRTPELLKEIKNLGFKLKYIVNEACIYGCPQNINHACYIANSINYIPITYYCERPKWKYSDILKTNFILPRHLKLFDEFVDIYKIAGRNSTTDRIILMIDAYVNERNDIDLVDIMTSRLRTKLFKSKNISIPVNRIPDKLLTCKCAECDTCNICNKVIKKCIKDSGIDILKLDHEI